MAGIDTYTKLCLHMDGDQSDSNHTVTVSGNPILNSTTKKFGASSVYFDGSGDYLTIPDHGDWDFGSGDFTIDFWANHPVSSTNIDPYYFSFGAALAMVFYPMDHAISDRRGKIRVHTDSAGVDFYTSSSGIQTGWHHIAFVVEASGTATLYYDGQNSGADTRTSPFSVSDLITIGGYGETSDSNWGYDGYIDELRISNTARWTENFDDALPTSAYTSDANTKLLLHFDGDESYLGHEITFNGNPQMNATTTKFDGAYYFDGTGDYLEIADSEDWNFGTGDFTIDFWIWRDGAQSSVAGIVQQWTGTDGKRAWQLKFSGDNYLTAFISDDGLYDAAENITDSVALADQTWIHVALVRVGSTVTLYKDGNSVGTLEQDTVFNVDQVVWVGRNGAIYFKGYLDELRVSKGIARWTENFTPPTEPYNSQTILISGVKSEVARVIVFKKDNPSAPFPESNWSIESNTVVGGSGGGGSGGGGSDAYEVPASDTGDRIVLARANSGEAIVFGKLKPLICTGTPPKWDYDTSIDTIELNSSGLVAVTGGPGPYEWSIWGTGFWLNAERKLPRTYVTSSNQMLIYTDERGCGLGHITVETCRHGTAYGYVAGPGYPPEWDYDTSVETIGLNSSGLVSISGGVDPFTWSISGQGFWLNSEHTTTGLETSGGTILIYTDENACGAATITAKTCEKNIVGHVRCTTGHWEEISYDCGLPGAATEVTTFGERVETYRIVGNKKQYVRFIRMGTTGSELQDSCEAAASVICNLDVDCIEFTLDCSAFIGSPYLTLCGQRTCRTDCRYWSYSDQYYYDCRQAIPNQITYYEWECA
jgi:hypothetical protein